MKRYLLVSLVSVLVVSAVVESAAGQAGGGHILFGDFKVDDGTVSGPKPETFHLILLNVSGRVVSRQTISNNGRYRFFDLRNGEYDLVVELESQEVARVRVMLHQLQKTDVRQDVQLEWRGNAGPRTGVKTGTVSAVDNYKRDAVNETRFVKAQEAIKRKENDQAIALILQVVESDPKDFVAWTELGTLHFKKDEFDDAEKFYLRALGERPEFFLALLNLGKARLTKKNNEGAVEVLARAVETQPLSADANYFLGEAYLQIKKGSKAVGYLNEAIRLDPAGKAEAHLRLATLYNGAGLKDKAATEYEAFLAKRSDYPQRKQLEDYISRNKKK